MGDGVFNISKGKVAEYAERILANDPANSVFHIELAFGAATDATIKDYDSLGALLADAGVDVATFTNYADKQITNPTVTPDDSGDKNDVDIPDQTWSSAGNGSNNTLTRLFVCYDSDSTAGTDSAIIPCTFHDFAVTTDGSDLTAQFNAQGFFSAG